MTIEVHGTCDEKFASVRDLLAKNIEDGQDVGSSFALTINGESVIDLGWSSRRSASARMAERHHHQRLQHDQNHVVLMRVDTGRSWPA